MVSISLVVGFHGCDKAVAEKVVSGMDDLRSSGGPWEWLGYGIYFWEDSYSRALRWAEEQAGRKDGKVTSPAVVGAVIDLGNCLNLIDAEDLGFVKAAHEGYLEFCKASSTAPAANRGPARFLDCAVMETLHRLREHPRHFLQDRSATLFATVLPFCRSQRPARDEVGLDQYSYG